MTMDRRLCLPAALLAVLAATSAEAPVASADPAPAPPPPCDAWEVDYSLAATVVISDTPMGAGDGSYPNGPGHLKLRFDNQGGQPGGQVKMLDYSMKDNFTVVSKALAWETRVTADTTTKATPDACGVEASGALDGKAVRWNGTVNGMRSDGAVICSGSFCGKFGGPPEGRSEMHVPPHAVSFKPFTFAADMKTFSMPLTEVTKQSSPSSTSSVTLSGREVRRSCVAVRACP
jgi:hypothetical protein